MKQQAIDANSPDASWRALYIAGAAAAILAVAIFRRNLGVELHTFDGFGIFDVPGEWPITAQEWFSLLQADPFVGLVLFGVVDLVNYVLVGIIFLALYGALRRVNRAAMLAATTSCFVGIAAYLASNQSFSMLSLSSKHAAAASSAEIDMFLAAGEALLAVHDPGSLSQGIGIYASLFFVLAAGLIVSIVMLKSAVFNNATAIVGILANGIALFYFISLLFAPEIVWIPHTLSAPLRLIWYILIAIKLIQLALRSNDESSDQPGASKTVASSRDRGS